RRHRRQNPVRGCGKRADWVEYGGGGVRGASASAFGTFLLDKIAIRFYVFQKKVINNVVGNFAHLN
ncbi:MAG: hypothetical protein D6767_01815, partial [Candidatus Hydrogenedentota bacterium]